MNPQPPPSTEPLDIGRICERECARHGWKLAGEPVLLADGRSFEQRVRERVTGHCAEENLILDEAIIIRGVKTEYGTLLHHGVALNGHRAQSIALEETNRAGWNVALYKCNGNKEEAESVLYSALLKLWQHIGNVRPESYFQYFFQILNREIQLEWRKRNSGSDRNVTPGAVHPNQEGADNPEESDDVLADTGATGASAYERLLDNLALGSLVEILHKCLQNPRWTFVIVSNFVLELNASEIAAQLRTTVSAIYMIKHHARQHMKTKCAETLLPELRMRLQLA